MPLSTSDVLDAYRADLSNAGRSRFSDRDAAWLAFGTLLQRAVNLPAGERPVYLRSIRATVNAPSAGALSDALDEFERDPSPDAFCAMVTNVATEVEEAGAFALATAMLDFARILVGLSEFRLQGRLLAHQARILRKIGEVDPAHELYDQVAEIGETHADRELIARSRLGKGVLARVRGNYPEARREFLAVLAIDASSNAIRELHAHAHQGMLIVSAIAGDFDAAIKHGAAGVSGAADEHRVVLLQNLASVCYDAGQFRSALHGQLQALAATRLERVRLPALGGAAVAAGRLGEAQIVEELVRAAEPLLRQRAPEFELADMIREFAEAYGYLGDIERWRRFRDEALARAQRGKFFEIVHRIESMRAPTATVPAPEIALTRDALAVAARLASGDSGELLTAAVSSGRSDSHSR
jgi:tetratricopeptide (TPR) repeat protein